MLLSWFEIVIIVEERQSFDYCTTLWRGRWCF